MTGLTKVGATSGVHANGLEYLDGGVDRLTHAVVHVDVKVVREPAGEEQALAPDRTPQLLLVAGVQRPVALGLDGVVARRRTGELEAEHGALALLARGVLGLVDPDEREL